jgi:hypothetical protein
MRREEEFLPLCARRSDNGALNLTTDFWNGVKGCWAGAPPEPGNFYARNPYNGKFEEVVLTYEPKN